ncbi:MAG TPA: TonB family protein [Candidatus Acidoferrum sp.]|nr:TonB family protein [Candidatus Acidoferrum sp.]
MFRRFQVNPFDLLGQNELYPYPVYLPGKGEPKLSIAWNSFHQNFFSELAVFFRWTRVPKGEPAGNIFVDCRIQRRIPYSALLAAALWHVLFFVVPWPHLHITPKHVSALDNTELTWSGPVEDLPLLNVPKQHHNTTAQKTAVDDPPADATDAFHPRQRIFTDPSHPTHPRQTLVNTTAPNEPPQFVPPLPNMVLLAAPLAPARPRLQISEQTLAKLRPKEVKKVATTAVPAPDVPNMETRPSEMSLAQLADSPAKPRLEINAGSAPRVADRAQNGEVAPAPEVAAGITGSADGPAATIIALSSAPAPPAPVVEVPKGNLEARVAISPEGKGNGTGGGSATPSIGAGNGSGSTGGDPAEKSSIGISISGGSPKPNAGVSGLGTSGKLTLPKTTSIYKRPDPNTAIEDPPERTGPPNFAALPPGAPPEQIFSSHHVYSMNVDMPNLNSVTGSWIIHFSEMHLPGVARTNGLVNAPGPLRKVDPKYPQDLVQEHVEGEVILYGVIRPDGSVDSIQIVRSLDKQLDANAVEALSQWKFRPATKDGQPVALEAIVHIPFRGPQRE